MPLYLRKSIKAGPFRFNFSKGGVGVSVGVKGLRLGTGPRGHYVHAGRGGIYYRASLGKGPRNSGSPTQNRRIEPSLHSNSENFGDRESEVEMIDIDSADVLSMRDESFAELLDELNGKQSKIRASRLFTWLAISAACGAMLSVGESAAWTLLAAIPAWVLGRWLDSYRRVSVLFFELDSEIEEKYSRVAEAFDAMMASKGKWHIEAGGAVQNLTTWKRNAGASHIVKKKPTEVSYRVPAVIKSNVTPPSLEIGRQRIYFFPDGVLIEDSKRFGAASYKSLNMNCANSNFIEEEKVPSDATVIGHTWKHPNKNGGPDRRFGNNYQIPICNYNALHMSSSSGINELVEFSRPGIAEPFVRAVKQLPGRREPAKLTRH